MRRTVARAGRGLVPAVRACRPLLRCRRQSRTYSSLLHHSSAALLSSSAFSSSAFTSAAWSSSSIMLPVVSSYRLCNYSTQSQRGAEVEEGEQGGEEPVKGGTRGGHDKDAASENGTVANNQKANESEPKPSSVTPTRRGRGARRCGNSRSSSSYMKTYHMTGAGEHTITQMKATTSRYMWASLCTNISNQIYLSMQCVCVGGGGECLHMYVCARWRICHPIVPSRSVYLD